MTESKEDLDQEIKKAQDRLNFYKMKKAVKEVNKPIEPKTQENELDKMFENLFIKFKDLIKEVEEQEDEEQDELDWKAEMSTRLSFQIKIALAGLLHEDKNISFAALCDVASSYGAHEEICKKAQMSAFEKCVDHHIEVYTTHKDKIDKIKAILKGE